MVSGRCTPELNFCSVGVLFVVIQPGKEKTARIYVHFYFMDDFQDVVAKIDWEFASISPMRTFIFPIC